VRSFGCPDGRAERADSRWWRDSARSRPAGLGRRAGLKHRAERLESRRWRDSARSQAAGPGNTVPVRSRLRVQKKSESESESECGHLDARMAGPSDQIPADGGIPRGARLQGRAILCRFDPGSGYRRRVRASARAIEI
jgi:hypothetical protein